MADYFGSDEDDYFRGTATIDNMFGRGGNDRLRGGGEADYLYGEVGRDDLRGDDGDDVLSGGEGDDALRGGLGDDILRSEAGVDLLDGGEGFDRISFFTSAATAGAVVNLATQVVENDGFGNRETLTSIESLGLGTLFADLFLGSDDRNFFWADAGDTVIGLGGNDSIRVGSIGRATIDGGEGFDGLTVDGGSARVGSDGQLVLVYAPEGVVIDLERERMTDGFGAKGRVIGIESVVGGATDDRIAGSSTENFLAGEAGNDRLFGLDGDDSLEGGLGNDLIEGGAGGDFLFGDSSFEVGQGDDTLIGGDGNDILFGGGGVDRLFGGAGSDQFFFGSGDTGITRETADRILDYQQGVDQIAINGVGVTFIGTNAFTGASGEARYELRGGDTFVYVEADGQAGADIVIRLAGQFTLTASDFQV